MYRDRIVLLRAQWRWLVLPTLVVLLMGSHTWLVGMSVNATPAHGIEPVRVPAASALLLNLPPVQEAYIKASNTGLGDYFGTHVALSGDTLVIGAPGEASAATGVNGDQQNEAAFNSGAVYVFVRSGDTWVQQAYLKASNTGINERFGSSVAISGDILVVGAPDEPSSATGINGDQTRKELRSAGAAYVFVRVGSTWSQEAYLKASNTMRDAVFGHSVAIAGSTIVIGAYGESSGATGVNGDQDSRAAPAAGAAYVFTRAEAGWSQQAYLKASNTESYDGFGYSVAVDGDTAVVSAFRESSNATGVNGDQTSNQARYAGAAYVFARTGSTWSQQAYLKASNAEAYDYFGERLALSGGTLVISAAREDSAATGVNGDQTNNAAYYAGAAYVFTRSAGVWSQQAYLKASNTEAEDTFGSSVFITGDTIVVGAPGEDSAATGIDGDQSNNGMVGAGAAYVFVRTATTWSQQAYVKASTTGSDGFGSSLAVTGTTLLVGAPFEDSNATGVNGDQTNNSASEAGAAYAFDLAPAPPPTATPTATPVVTPTLSATSTAVPATSVATPPTNTPSMTATAPVLTVTVQSPTPAPLLNRLYLPHLLTE